MKKNPPVRPADDKAPGRRNTDKKPPVEEEKPDIDWTAYLFGGYDAGVEKVSLYRKSPKEYQGFPCGGWLDDIGPGVDENYIRDNYGGGQFQLNKRNRANGQITATCTFEIPGFPKISPAAIPKTVDEDQGAGAPVMLKVGDSEVPFDGNLGRFSDFILLMKSLEQAFPAKPDINTALLELALRRDPVPDPLEMIRMLKEASGMLGGQSEAGSNIYDLIREGINQAGPVIQSMMLPGVRRIARTAPGVVPGGEAGKVSGLLPVDTGAEAGKTVDITPEGRQTADGAQPINEEAVMSQRELILAVVSTIVQCWKLDPPKNVAATVRMIDLVLQQTDADVRKQLADNFSETILDVCETQLAEEWSYPESTIGKRPVFVEFFSKLFEEYARKDRTVVML